MKQVPRNPLVYRLEAEDVEGDFPRFLEELTNLPDSPALFHLAIDRAGITKQLVSINLPPLHGTEQHLRLPVLCEVEAGASLSECRGVHMSRFEEALFSIASGDEYDSVDSFAALVASAVREKQRSDSSFVRVTGTMITTRPTRVTGKISHDPIVLIGEAQSTPTSLLVTTGVKVHNVTACPCTRTFTKFSVVPALMEKGFSVEQVREILDTVLTGTHLQRGSVSLSIEKSSTHVTSSLLFEVLDRSTHLVFDLLKRPDEHELVIRALQRPQFTEDVARDVSREAYRALGDRIPDTTRLRVRSELLDSIHIHDVFTEIDTTFAKVANAFALS